MSDNEPIIKFLPCKLTEEEYKAKSADLANTITDLEELEADFDRLKKQMSEQIKDKTAEYKRLAKVVRDKIENREVECFEERNDKKLIINVIRADTFETVQTRPMTETERQLVMFPTRPRLVQDSTETKDDNLETECSETETEAPEGETEEPETETEQESTPEESVPTAEITNKEDGSLSAEPIPEEF